MGAFAGLRVAEVAALRVSGVDFIRGVVHPKRQWPDKPLKTDGSGQPIPIPIPIPQNLASLLIASGADIKAVQARMRHASARTMLDTYGHLWPDADESTRAAVGAVIAERVKSAAYPLPTEAPC